MRSFYGQCNFLTDQQYGIRLLVADHPDNLEVSPLVQRNSRARTLLTSRPGIGHPPKAWLVVTHLPEDIEPVHGAQPSSPAQYQPCHEPPRTSQERQPQRPGSARAGQIVREELPLFATRIHAWLSAPPYLLSFNCSVPGPTWSVDLNSLCFCIRDLWLTTNSPGDSWCLSHPGFRSGRQRALRVLLCGALQ